MRSHPEDHKRYLKLGDVAVAIHCPSTSFVEEACEHIFLSKDSDGPTIANIRYILDDSVEDEVTYERKDNVVYINRKQMDNGRERIVLGMFNNFTAVLEVAFDDVVVRYPTHAPVRLLLDDVFQAALQPVLDNMGGFILHGACMVRANKAIVLMGNSGSGKSTTAFNLTRFGFSGYADDAVLVTPHDGTLTVWPLTRELSLRPLSFRLFQKQGISLGQYKKYDEKYYFPQAPQAQTGAALAHICFLEISGESESQLTHLNAIQTHEILTANNRHFSFMGRTDAKKYARILSKGVPAPLFSKLGTDLDFQGSMFDQLFSGTTSESAHPIKPKTKMATRSEKSDLIRQAWANPNQEPLQQLIPLLGDFDPTIFKLALGFFQTLPIASILPIHTRDNGSQRQTTELVQDAEDPVPWLRTTEWLQGCKILLEQSGEEVFQRFAYSWIKSAPLLYPFFKHLLADENPKPLNEAWTRYCSERPSMDAMPLDQLHLIGMHKRSVWATPEANAWLKDQLETDQLYCWVDEDNCAEWASLVPKLNLPRNATMTVVPVLHGQNSIQSATALVQAAKSQGVSAKICRQLPLCRLGADQAQWLLEANAFTLYIEKRTEKIRFFSQPGTSEVTHSNPNAFGLAWPDGFVRFLSNPYDDCQFCRLATLEMCHGGFFKSA